MPDLYQGCEMWDLSLVDPDNRRPVDYAARADALAALGPALADDPAATLRDLLEGWPDGRIKLAVVSMLLGLRARHPALFARGSYDALPASGEKSDQVLGFLRREGEAQVAVLVARYPGLREADPHWRDTCVALPDGAWRDLFSRREFGGGETAPASLFDLLPAAILVRG